MNAFICMGYEYSEEKAANFFNVYGREMGQEWGFEYRFSTVMPLPFDVSVGGAGVG